MEGSAAASRCAVACRGCIGTMISIVDVESVERSWRPEEMARRGVEAQESSNLTLYRTALHHETHNCADEAMHAYSKLLEQPLIADASRERAASRDPSLQLRFLALKNLSALESARPSDCDEYGMLTESALQHALEALAIDETDSLLWLRLGRLAQRTGRVSLARHALEQVRLVPRHPFVCMLRKCIALGPANHCPPARFLGLSTPPPPPAVRADEPAQPARPARASRPPRLARRLCVHVPAAHDEPRRCTGPAVARLATRAASPIAVHRSPAQRQGTRA